MNRRDFARLSTFAAASAWATPLSALQLRSAQALQVDRTRLAERMRTLATFGANEAGGIDRVAFSDADIEARAWIGTLLSESGFSVGHDLAGNLVATKPGAEPDRPPIAFGSHIDSVPGGGNFDGQVGSMAAVEVAAVLSDAGYRTRHPLELLLFTNEEGGKTGSRALSGEVEPFELELLTASGYTIGDGLRRLGGDPDRLAEARREPGSITAFMELHVEQGAILDRDGTDIGVVEGIVGIVRWNVVVTGVTNHAGTTPMDQRADAMVGAARIIDAVHRTAREMPGRQVATVGRIEASPGAPNVIPGQVRMTLEIRDLSMEGIERVFTAIEPRAQALAREAEVEVKFERFYTSRAAPTDPRIRDVVERESQGLGLTASRMASGAGHDAQSMALLGPVGMIFVPSRGGFSHTPQEFTEAVDVANGADVLLRTLLTLDRIGLS